MNQPLADRIALVTGASRGIGAEIALELARAGAHIIATARTVGGLEELDDRIKTEGGSTTLVPLDIKDSDGIARLALAINERYHRLDVLVGNAGQLGALSPVGHVELKAWDDILAINLTANWQLIRCMDPLLKASPAGRAVFLSSGLSWKARAYTAPYAATKAALNMLVATYAAECASSNVRANLFNPGPTRTRMYRGGWPGVDPQTLTPPEEVAKAVRPLCLPDFTETGKFFDFPTGRLLALQQPA